MGSWKFIIFQSVFLLVWVILNVTAWISHWDPYPFILMNLTLSFQAAYAAPFIMMSQNRMSSIDREHAENAYHHVDEVNSKQDEQLKILLRQDDIMIQQHKELSQKMEDIAKRLEL